MKKMLYIDLFCGAGGTSTGVERAMVNGEKCAEVKVLANIENDDIDLSMVIEQLWEDLQLARIQIAHTMDRNDFYAKHFKLDDKFNG